MVFLLHVGRLLLTICRIVSRNRVLCEAALRANKLSLNYNKTNFMLLTSRKHNPASFKLP